MQAIAARRTGFDNDRLAIDFAATKFGLPWAPVEMLWSHWDLRDWIAGSGVVSGGRDAEPADLRRARAVRHLIVDALDPTVPEGHRCYDRARHQLNQLARGPRALVQFRAPNRIIRRGGVPEFFTELAVDTLDLLADATLGRRIRWCSAPGCRRIFLDRSPNGERRWCSRACNNRVSRARARERNPTQRRYG